VKLHILANSKKTRLFFGLQNVAADFSSKLPWKFWRYPKGLEKPEIYLNSPAATPEDEPVERSSRS